MNHNNGNLTKDEAHALTATALTSRLVQYLEDRDNRLDAPHRNALHALNQLMLDMADGKQPGKYAFGLPCGAGKTSAVIVFCAVMHERYTVAVAGSRVEALCQMKRDMIGQGVPESKIGLVHTYTYRPGLEKDTYGVGNEFASEPSTGLLDRPIMLVTHTRIRGGQTYLFNRHKGRLRNLRVWDESMLTAESALIPLKMLEEEIGAVERGNRGNEEFTPLNVFLDECSSRIQLKLKAATTEQCEQGAVLPAIQEERLDEFKRLAKENNYPTVHEFLTQATYPMRIIPATYQGAISYRPCVPSEIDSVLVLDASHSVREIVSYDETINDAEVTVPYVKAVAPLATIKRFDQVTVHQLFAGGGRKSMERGFGEDQNTLREVVTLVKDLPTNEGILVFLYKSRQCGDVQYRKMLDTALKRAGIDTNAVLPSGQRRINMLTFGQETNLNDYAFCTRVILCGVLHRNRADITGQVLGLQHNIGADVSHDEITRVIESEVCHVILQAIQRGACRTVDNGLAGKMDAYVIYKDAGIRPRLDKAMPGVKWVTWLPQHGRLTVGQTQTIASLISTYLDSLPESVGTVEDPLPTHQIKAFLKMKNDESAERLFRRALKVALEMNQGWKRKGNSLVRAASFYGFTEEAVA